MMSETQEQELKPCPCGDKHPMVMQRPQWKGNTHRWAVMCGNPDCHFVNDGHKTEAKARAAWNRRAADPAAQWTNETPSEEGLKELEVRS
jgi:hypothetical protein